MTTRCSGESSGSRSTSGIPMFPPRTDRVVGIRGEDRGDQRRRRRLALRPRHPDRRRRAEAQEQVRLRDQGRRGRVAAPVSGDERLERSPQPRFGRRVVGVDRGRRRDKGGAGPRRLGGHVRAGENPGRPPLERRDGVGKLGDRSAVVDRDVGAGVGEEAGQRDPAPGQPEDRHRPAAEVSRANAVERQRVEVDRPFGRHRGAHSSCRIEARNSVTPSSPDRIPMIQKRSVIFSSSQPASSKWWWIGVNRNSRFPPVALK